MCCKTASIIINEGNFEHVTNTQVILLLSNKIYTERVQYEVV